MKTGMESHAQSYEQRKYLIETRVFRFGISPMYFTSPTPKEF